MLRLMVTLLFGAAVFEALGWAIHRVMHSSWSGPIWRAHLTHHRLYAKEFLSDSYRRAGVHAATRYYVAVSLPIVAAMFLALPWSSATGLAAELALYGWLNNAVHDASHVRDHWLARAPWFLRLRELHRVHHRNAAKNFGLLTLLPDRLFGTFRAPRS